MKKSFVVPLLLFASITSRAQIFVGSDCSVSFFSATSMENIDAVNKAVKPVLNSSTGELLFRIQNTAFKFKSQLMEDHFNENYMESDKFPKAFFKGKLKTDKPVLLQTENSYSANAEGILTIHGVSKQVLVPVTVNSKNGVISSKASFAVLLADYKITVPSIVADKINQLINISVLVPAYKKL